VKRRQSGGTTARVLKGGVEPRLTTTTNMCFPVSPGAHYRRILDLATGLRILSSGKGLIEDFQCTEIMLGGPLGSIASGFMAR
jgi:hypothetical protein